MSATTLTTIPVQALKDIRICAYINAASMALLLYDYALTFGEEVDLIWASKMSAIKVLFFLTRYTPFVDVPLIFAFEVVESPSAVTCTVLQTCGICFIIIGMVVAETILTVRTWALWDRNFWLGMGLLTASVTILITLCVYNGIFLNSVTYTTYPRNSKIVGCLVLSRSDWSAVAFAEILGYEILLLILTSIKGLQHYRTSGTRGVAQVAYRDGVLFYLYLCCLSAANIGVSSAAQPDLVAALATFQRVMHSSLSARVILHLRAAAKEMGNLNISQLETFAIHSLPVFARPSNSHSN